jgi:hypothetical protein
VVVQQQLGLELFCAAYRAPARAGSVGLVGRSRRTGISARARATTASVVPIGGHLAAVASA